MEYKKVDLEVGLNVFRTVAYAWEADDDKVAVHMIYEGRPIVPLECWPPLLITNDDQVKELVRVTARLLYDEEKAANGE